jgi:hypothetical protein
MHCSRLDWYTTSSLDRVYEQVTKLGLPPCASFFGRFSEGTGLCACIRRSYCTPSINIFSCPRSASHHQTPESAENSIDSSLTHRLRAGKPGFDCVGVRPRLSCCHRSKSRLHASDTHDDITRRESILRSRDEYGACLCELHVFQVDESALSQPRSPSFHSAETTLHIPTPSNSISWNDTTKDDGTDNESKHVNRYAL